MIRLQRRSLVVTLAPGAWFGQAARGFAGALAALLDPACELAAVTLATRRRQARLRFAWLAALARVDAHPAANHYLPGIFVGKRIGQHGVADPIGLAIVQRGHLIVELFFFRRNARQI